VPAWAASPSSGLRSLSVISNAREGFVPEDMHRWRKREFGRPEGHLRLRARGYLKFDFQRLAFPVSIFPVWLFTV